MRFNLKIGHFITALLLYQTLCGQKNLNGTYIWVDSTSSVIKSKEVVIIKGDSIWMSKENFGSNISIGERYVKSIGEITYFKTGYKDGPFYSGSLMVMECDTCPEFWKYTLNRRDSTNLKTYVWTHNENAIDTFIKNGDTLYTTPAIVDMESPIDSDRYREFIFTISKNGDILNSGKLYKRRRKNS